MNLHNLASQVISSVNPMEPVTLRQSTGYTTAADGSRTGTYATSTINAQIQHLTFTDLKAIEGLNIVGLRRKLYLYGAVNSMVRGLQKGNDLITFADGSVWLIAFVFETYGHDLQGSEGWCSVCVTLQDSTAEC